MTVEKKSDTQLEQDYFDRWPDDVIGTTVTKTGSRTQDAIKWMTEQGCTPYAAAKKFGIAPVNVYRALKEQAKDKPRCECCGQVIRKT